MLFSFRWEIFPTLQNVITNCPVSHSDDWCDGSGAHAFAAEFLDELTAQILLQLRWTGFCSLCFIG
jgi:hypothetical protein